jgi:hypothetical protein
MPSRSLAGERQGKPSASASLRDDSGGTSFAWRSAASEGWWRRGETRDPLFAPFCPHQQRLKVRPSVTHFVAHPMIAEHAARSSDGRRKPWPHRHETPSLHRFPNLLRRAVTQACLTPAHVLSQSGATRRSTSVERPPESTQNYCKNMNYPTK